MPNLEGDITLNPGAEFYNVEIDPGSGRYRERLRSGDHGDYNELSIDFTARRLRVAISEFKRRHQNRRVHALFTDYNDETYYYKFLRLRTADLDSGRSGGRNQASFVLSGSNVSPAAFFNASLIDDPSGQDDKIIIEGITGQMYCLTVGACDELITVPIETEADGQIIVVGDSTIIIGEDGELETIGG